MIRYRRLRHAATCCVSAVDWQLQAFHCRRRLRLNRSPAAKSCILVYLLGGPPHLDMFDLKPEAPAEIRGPFGPIATSVPGLQICEHLPRLARLAHATPWSARSATTITTTRP